MGSRAPVSRRWRPRLYWLSFEDWGRMSSFGFQWERIYLNRKEPVRVPPGGRLVGNIGVGPDGMFITSRWTPFIRTTSW